MAKIAVTTQMSRDKLGYMCPVECHIVKEKDSRSFP